MIQTQSLSSQTLITFGASTVCVSQDQFEEEKLRTGVTSLRELRSWLQGKDFRECSEGPSPVELNVQSVSFRLLISTPGATTRPLIPSKSLSFFRSLLSSLFSEFPSTLSHYHNPRHPRFPTWT